MEKVHGLYGSEFMECRSCGLCKYHRCHLTVKQLRRHDCLSKQCRYLVKNEEHNFWKQRERLKQKKKAKKQMFNEYIASFSSAN